MTDAEAALDEILMETFAGLEGLPKPRLMPGGFIQFDPPPKKWTGLGRSTLGLGWADVAQG